jgi:hypothetical protein
MVRPLFISHVNQMLESFSKSRLTERQVSKCYIELDDEIEDADQRLNSLKLAISSIKNSDSPTLAEDEAISKILFSLVEKKTIRILIVTGTLTSKRCQTKCLQKFNYFQRIPQWIF